MVDYSEQILEATPCKTGAAWPLNFHLTIRARYSWHRLIRKDLLIIDGLLWTPTHRIHQCWPNNEKSHSSVLCRHLMSSRETFNRDGWWERIEGTCLHDNDDELRSYFAKRLIGLNANIEWCSINICENFIELPFFLGYKKWNFHCRIWCSIILVYHKLIISWSNIALYRKWFCKCVTTVIIKCRGISWASINRDYMEWLVVEWEVPVV